LALYPSIEETPGWHALEDALSKALSDKGVPPDKRQLYISFVGSLGASKVSKAAAQLADAVDKSSASRTRTAENTLIQALLATSIAEFNLFVGKQRDVALSGTKWLSGAESMTRQRLAELQRAVAKNAPDKVLETSFSAKSVLLTEIDVGVKLASELATTNDITLHAMRERVAAGLGLRNLLLAYTIMTFVEHAVSSGTASQLRGMAQTASKLDRGSMDSSFPGVGGSVSRRFDWIDGKEVNVIGVLETLEITHIGSKAVSQGALRLADDSFITVAAPYVKLDSGGGVTGATVRIVGKCTSNIEWLQKQAAVVPSRVGLGAEVNKSWIGHLEAAVSFAYIRRPHGLVIDPSWVKGPNGAGNVLKFDTYFSGEGKG